MLSSRLSQARSAETVLCCLPPGRSPTPCTNPSHLSALPTAWLLQVLLPPTGGRVVLATDGVWSQAGEAALRAMRGAAVKTAAHEVIKAVVSGRYASAEMTRS